MAGSTVSVQIVGNAAPLQSALVQSERGLQAFSRKAQAFGARMTRAGSTMTRGLTLPIAAIGYVAFRELSESQRVFNSTEAVIESMGIAAQVSAPQIADMATEMREISGLDDEGIQEMLNTLLTFREVVPIIEEAGTAAHDMAAFFGGDMQTAATQVGRALNNPLRGLTALTRRGVEFTEQQRTQVEAMMAVGDIAGAQRIILQELTDEYGGQAAALGDTVGGKLGELRQQFEDLAASILESLMPVLEDLADMLTNVADKYKELTPDQQKAVAGVVGMAFVAGPATSLIGGLAKVVGYLAYALGLVGAAFGLTGGAAVAAGAAVVGGAIAVIVGIGWIVTHWRETEEFFRNSWNNIKGMAGTFWGQIKTTVSNAVTGMASAVRNKLGEILAWFSALPGKIIGVLKALPGQLFNLGVDAIQSFINGLQSVSIGDVISGIGNVAQGALNAINPFEAAAGPAGGTGNAPTLTPIDLERAFERVLSRTPSPVYLVGSN